MGEVYRADDLKLGQAVALKFLPEQLEADRGRRDRFLNEVKVALRVTHPNVCRVHDIGEVDGRHYISMEYIDGEDLASLLRRIGRLPQDKAVQIARQLCAGLAAAHEEGILHRDFKPANVMIDGRGRAKITDFGLASLAGGVEGAEVGAGTPGYMAPEQAAGREVTVRSDVYALGLVLYELFTGKRAFEASSLADLRRLQEQSSPTTPASHVEGLDPSVERAILRCLEREAAQRPASPLAVAASLPGGDPLAAALAAGETPSPEMVAAAGTAGGLRPAIAAACLGFIVAFFVAWILVPRTVPALGGLYSWAPLPHPPQVLAQKATEILERLGYDDPPVDHAFGFFTYGAYLNWIEENDDSTERWERLRSGKPSAFIFWYRQSPQRLQPNIGSNVAVNASNPRQEDPGEVRLYLTADGRVDHMRIIPMQVDEPSDEPGEVDWATLIETTGLDPASLQPVESAWIPDDFADTRAAWEGSWPEQPDLPLRIEAAAYRGRPVALFIREPWELDDAESETPPGQKAMGIFFGMILLALMIGAVLLARRNLRLGRGDRKGAFKMAVFVLAVGALGWVLDAHHTPEILDELELFFLSYPGTVFLAGMVWLVYIALEPFLRSRWPDAMVSWSRLLAGRFRDPLVGRDILVGMTAACGISLMFGLVTVVGWWMGVPESSPGTGPLVVLLGGRRLLSQIIGSVFAPLLITGAILLLLLILRVLLRKHWIAIAAMVVVLSIPPVVEDFGGPLFLLEFAAYLLFWVGIYLLLSRFGLLSVCAVFFFAFNWGMLPDLDFSTWYAGNSIVILLILAAVLGFSFYTSLAGRSLFGDSMVPGD
jgi:serine/threonine-protein kinase